MEYRIVTHVASRKQQARSMCTSVAQYIQIEYVPYWFDAVPHHTYAR